MGEEVRELARKFNQEVSPTKNGQSCNVYVRPSRLYEMTEDKKDSKGRIYLRGAETLALEPMIHGEYEKFNSNTGWSSGNASLPDAFSHWTWVHSGGDLLVCDLLGHRGRPGGPKYGG